MKRIRLLTVLIMLFLVSGCKIDGGGGASVSSFSDPLEENTVNLLTAESTDTFSQGNSEFSTQNFEVSSQENNTSSPVPEPSTVILLAIGLGSLAMEKFKNKIYKVN